MPSDDRERNFDNALASHLRAGDLRKACSDAETLAAYHERALDPLQMASLQAHLNDCPRCQEILTHLQSTDEIPVPGEISPQSSSPAITSGRLLPIRRPKLWLWTAPAGALAAVLLVWISVRENTPVRVPAQEPATDLAREVAKDQSVSSPTASSPSLEASRRQDDTFSNRMSPPNAAPPSPIGAPAKQPSQSLSKEKDSRSAAKKSSGLDNSHRPAFDLKESPKPPSQPDVQNLISHGAVTETVTVEAGVPTQSPTDQLPKVEPEVQTANKRDTPSPQPAPPPAAAGNVPAAARAQSGEPVQSMSQTVEVSGALVQQQQMEGRSRFEQKAEMRLANVLAEVTISAPGGRASWRVGPAGLIQFSSDAGKTWTVQPSGVVTDLFAGSASSDRICWIVGRAGTILRTTDGGRHWQKTRAPTQDDFHSVFAVNARSAKVSLANASYQTTDGGATWNKLPPE